MPKVTVWLTSYNHEKFIGQSIESILTQTYSDYELFIIDDCSSDHSWDVIQQYAKKDARIKAIRHSYNQGGSGMYDMLDELNGEYIAIAHCDDMWMPDKLEKQVLVLEENHDVAACFTLVEVIDDEGNVLSDKRHLYCSAFEQPNRTRYEWLNHFFYCGNCLCHPSLLIRKNAYADYGMYARGLSGLPDFCQWIRLCKKAELFILQERMTKFRVHGDESNTSGDNRGNHVRVCTEEWLLLKEYEELVKTSEVTKVFPETAKYIIDGEISEKYALAQVMFEHPKNSYKLYGLQLLYDILQDVKETQKIERLYGYTRKNYNVDKQRYDIFHVIPDSRQLQVSIYLNGENGFNEQDKICVDAFVQQTDRFFVKVDLRQYPETMLKCIRIDLDEGKYRRFRICKCMCGNKTLAIIPMNGIREGAWDTFYTADPQYTINMEHGGILYIEGYTEELTWMEVEQYYHQIEQERNALSDEIYRMKNTKIWKIGTGVKRILGR